MRNCGAKLILIIATSHNFSLTSDRNSTSTKRVHEKTNLTTDYRMDSNVYRRLRFLKLTGCANYYNRTTQRGSNRSKTIQTTIFGNVMYI